MRHSPHTEFGGILEAEAGVRFKGTLCLASLQLMEEAGKPWFVETSP